MGLSTSAGVSAELLLSKLQRPGRSLGQLQDPDSTVLKGCTFRGFFLMAWEVAAGVGIKFVVQSRTVSGKRKRVALIITGKEQARLRICSPSGEVPMHSESVRGTSTPSRTLAHFAVPRGGRLSSRKAISRRRTRGAAVSKSGVHLPFLSSPHPGPLFLWPSCKSSQRGRSPRGKGGQRKLRSWRPGGG